uniref:Uncharacterized protein n=1 Tax=Pavo cristatus TaxID=9049 RepID=A0A8C9G0S2_PAVCR
MGNPRRTRQYTYTASAKTGYGLFALLCFPSACDRLRKNLHLPPPLPTRLMKYCSGNYLCLPITNPCFYFLSFYYRFLRPTSHPPDLVNQNLYNKLVG